MLKSLCFGSFLFLHVFALHPAAHALSSSFGLNDVSVLIPLPNKNTASELLSPSSSGARGTLMPQAQYSRFPVIESQSDGQTLYRQYLKVIGIRLDPCFTEGSSTRCRRQIRLVWQPVIFQGNRATTLDAAMHSFYEFSDSEWKVVMQKWATLERTPGGQGLQIHPVLKQEGLTGPAWRAMKAIILAECGQQNLVRLTAMRLTAQRMWTFFGIDKVGASFNFMTIPRVVSNRAQAFILNPNAMASLKEFSGQLAPDLKGGEMLQEFVKDSDLFRARRPEKDVKALMNEMFRFENPRFNNPGTVDCASCHMAQTIVAWGKRNYQQWDWSRDFSANQFKSPLNLENNSVNAAPVNRVRAFGYFNADPIFSQRVINESATVAASLR